MKLNGRKWWAAAAVVLVTLPVLAKPNPEPAALAKVRVLNLNGVPQQTLYKAIEETAAIFGHAGLKISWIDCQTDPACQPPLPADELQLSVVGGGSGMTNGKGEVVGFAAWPCARVYYAYIEQRANESNASPYHVLALAIAHELGHVLLGPGNHSTAGVMRPSWKQKDLENIARQPIFFTGDEGRRMRANLPVFIAQTAAFRTSANTEMSVDPRTTSRR